MHAGHTKHHDDYAIFEAVRDAFLPFKVGQITLEIEEGLERRLVVWVDILPKHLFKVEPDWDVFIRAPHWAGQHIGRLLAEQIRNLPAIPVDDHIHLGEE